VLDFTDLDPQSLRRLRREEYDKLVELGYFDDESVELLYGFVVPMVPEGPPHAGAIQWLTETLVLALRGRASLRCGHPLALGESEPEPDVALVPPGDYRLHHPTEAWLVVEVAESSLRKDRGLKRGLYAEHGVTEYWVVNLVDRLVEVHTEPLRNAYTRVVSYRAGERIRLQRFADVEVPVDALLPPISG
jgi:Uma2 family endonuclease